MRTVEDRYYNPAMYSAGRDWATENLRPLESKTITIGQLDTPSGSVICLLGIIALGLIALRR